MTPIDLGHVVRPLELVDRSALRAMSVALLLAVAGCTESPPVVPANAADGALARYEIDPTLTTVGRTQACQFLPEEVASPAIDSTAS